MLAEQTERFLQVASTSLSRQGEPVSLSARLKTLLCQLMPQASKWSVGYAGSAPGAGLLSNQIQTMTLLCEVVCRQEAQVCTPARSSKKVIFVGLEENLHSGRDFGHSGRVIFSSSPTILS